MFLTVGLQIPTELEHIHFKFWQIGVLILGLSSRRISKLWYLSCIVEESVTILNSLNTCHMRSLIVHLEVIKLNPNGISDHYLTPNNGRISFLFKYWDQVELFADVWFTLILHKNLLVRINPLFGHLELWNEIHQV